MNVRVTPARLRGQIAVPVSLVLVAGTAYLLLMASGRALEPGGFAALTSFYLLSNTIGRGTFAVLELELTRSVPAARARGHGISGPVRETARGGLVLLAVVVLLLLAAEPLLARVLGGWGGVVLLATASATLALSSLVRGPLAGDRRYGLFASNLALESAVYVVGAAVLLLARVDAAAIWMTLLAVAPLVGASVVLAGPIREGGRRIVSRTTLRGRVRFPTLLAGSALYLFSQAVWNLGPVITNGRTHDGALAATFAASAVLLRAPVMAFPAVQALVLPGLAAQPGKAARANNGLTTRVLVVCVGGAVAWLVVSILATPWVVGLLFSIPETPTSVVLGALSASVLIGLGVQATQTRLLAYHATALVAGSWALGVVLLVASALLMPDPLYGAAVGQLLAAAAVLVVQWIALRRRNARWLSCA